MSTRSSAEQYGRRCYDDHDDWEEDEELEFSPE